MKVGFICSNYYGFDAFKLLLGHSDIEPVFVVGLDERRFIDSGMAAYYYQGTRYFAYAIGHKISSYLTENLNDDSQLIGLLRRKQVDFIFAMGWPDILGREAIAIPRDGCVGIHPSWLPRYRGGAPLNWQFLDGCTQIGVSSFFFTEKVDVGNVLVQKLYDVPTSGNVTDFLEDTYIEATCEIFRETVQYLKEGGRGQVQELSEGFYRPRRRPEDSRISFNQPTTIIIRLVLAQSAPFPGAFFEYGGAAYFTADAEEVEVADGGPIGEVIEITPYTMVVRCVGGAIRLRGIIGGEPGMSLAGLMGNHNAAAKAGDSMVLRQQP